MIFFSWGCLKCFPSMSSFYTSCESLPIAIFLPVVWKTLLSNVLFVEVIQNDLWSKTEKAGGFCPKAGRRKTAVFNRLFSSVDIDCACVLQQRLRVTASLNSDLLAPLPIVSLYCQQASSLSGCLPAAHTIAALPATDLWQPLTLSQGWSWHLSAVFVFCRLRG